MNNGMNGAGEVYQAPPWVDVSPRQAEAPRIFAYKGLWQGHQPLLKTLMENYGHRRLDSFGGSYGWSVRYRQVEDYDQLGMTTLAEYLEAFQSGSARLPYLRHLSVNRAMPELRPLLRHPEEFGPNWVDHPSLDRFSGPELFVGQAGTAFGHVHQDQVNVHVGFVQLQGEKEFIVFPPEDSKFLDTMPGREFPYQMRNSRVRYRDINNFEKFPLLARAHPQRFSLKAGEALLLPADWWHTTRNVADSVSYSVRIINGSNIARSVVSHLRGLPRWLAKLRDQASVPTTNNTA